MKAPSPPLDALRPVVRTLAERSHVPYSQRATAALLLLEDGTLVPGVRVESASFSLTIPALVNAFTTGYAAGRKDVVAVALSRPFAPGERAYLEEMAGAPFTPVAGDTMARTAPHPLPEPGDLLNPFLDHPPVTKPDEGIALARQVAQRAFIPESQFPVGCVLVTGDGRLLPGVNVEHPDWARILCAERNALGTAVTYGLQEFTSLYLSCPTDPSGSPCGACRQLLSEQAPALALWMDRGSAPPASTTPEALLPGFFSGKALRPSPRSSS